MKIKIGNIEQELKFMNKLYMENLIESVKKKVLSSTGIKLELELEVIGKRI